MLVDEKSQALDEAEALLYLQGMSAPWKDFKG
jgi:hypothetical protein